MSCDRRDQELLFVLHNEAGAWTRWRTIRHLRRCAACRARLAEFEAVSTLLADDIRRDSRVPAWRRLAYLAAPAPALSRTSRPAALLLASAAAAGAIGALAYQVYRTVAPVGRSCTAPVRLPETGCVNCHPGGVPGAHARKSSYEK